VRGSPHIQGRAAGVDNPAAMSDGCRSLASVALALYRKYRPATFAEVVGQEHVTDPLRTALAAGRVNHAYLSSGANAMHDGHSPQGSGVGPWTQFSDRARIRADDVLPQPRGPEKR